MAWGKHTIADDGDLEILVGELGLHVRRSGRDFRIESSHDGAFDDVPERWALREPVEEISLTPCLPDRPILVVTRESLWVPGGGRLTLYVQLPLWVRVAISRPIALSLKEMPTEQMYNVWLGSKVRGHLGYWHPSEPRLDPPTPQDTHFGVAPVEIHNESSEPLDIESLEVDCPRLPLYQTDHGLWLGTSVIRYSSRGSLTTDVSGGLRPELESLAVLAAPDSSARQTLGTRAFARLRALSPL